MAADGTDIQTILIKEDNKMKKIFALLLTAASLSVSAQIDGLPATLPPIPEIPAKEPVGTVKMGDWQSFQDHLTKF